MLLGLVFRATVGQWRRTWHRGIRMRRNVVAGNFHGWRLFSNSECPVVELSPGLDMNRVKQDLGDFPKLSTNDDLKIDWDDKHLVLFHFFRGEGESCTIRLWDIEVGIKGQIRNLLLYIMLNHILLNIFRTNQNLCTRWTRVSSASRTRCPCTGTTW